MPIDIKGFARAGAQARLAELAAEIQAIRRAFPGLDGASERRSIIAADGDGQRQIRRRMSAAQRKAVSTRMKKYWASRRKATGTHALSATAPATTVKTASASKRVMSAEAKQKISAAQEKRSAARKGGAKKR